MYIRGLIGHITDCMTNDVPSRTFSQLLWVSAGRIALVGTWFLATILIGRVLGVIGFGFYVYCQTAIKIVTGCVGDPLDMAVMRQGPLLLKDNRPKALQLIRSAFWLRVLIGSLVLIAAVVLPTLASRTLFNRPDFHQLAMLTAGGVLGICCCGRHWGIFRSTKSLAGSWRSIRSGRAGALWLFWCCC